MKFIIGDSKLNALIHNNLGSFMVVNLYIA